MPNTASGDALAVRSLIDRLVDHTNHAEWDALASLFTEDAVWEARPPITWTFHGREAIRRGLAGNLNEVELLVQLNTAPVIHVEGPAHATSRMTISELLLVRSTGRVRELVGTYLDEFRKEDGAWRFSRRTFQLRFENDAAAPSQLRPERPGAVR